MSSRGYLFYFIVVSVCFFLLLCCLRVGVSVCFVFLAVNVVVLIWAKKLSTYH